MPFVEDPVHFSKSRLKADLIAHNVALPPATSRKEVYVELHLNHIHQSNAADFSSDEEDQVDVADKAEDPDDAEMPDPSSMTDDDLKAMLLKHGFQAGPIVASTRALYEKKLRNLLQSNGHDRLNGAEKAVLYSDSEEEEEDEEEEENGEEEDEKSGSEPETVEKLEQTQQKSKKAELHRQNGAFNYLQCFLPSSRLRACPSKNKEPTCKWNSRNALKSSEQSQPRCSQIPAGISRASSVDQRSGLGPGVPSGSKSVDSKGCASFSPQAFSITQMVEEMESRSSLSTSTDGERVLNGSNVQEHWSQSDGPGMLGVDKYKMKNKSLYYTPKASPRKLAMEDPVKAMFKDMFPETETTPTGIYAACRRPIKGAAQRPVQYEYPDTPVSPSTMERREVERYLVPIQIQILVFLIVSCILYMIYVNVEDSSSVLAFLDSLSQGSDGEEGPFLQAETQDGHVISGQD